VHGSEFKACETLTVIPDPFLPEEYRSAGRNLDKASNYRPGENCDRGRKQDQRNIQHPLPPRNRSGGYPLTFPARFKFVPQGFKFHALRFVWRYVRIPKYQPIRNVLPDCVPDYSERQNRRQCIPNKRPDEIPIQNLEMPISTIALTFADRPLNCQTPDHTIHSLELSVFHASPIN
jgi:hypothetical protein